MSPAVSLQHEHQWRHSLAGTHAQPHVRILPRQIVQGSCGSILSIRLCYLQQLDQGRYCPGLDDCCLHRAFASHLHSKRVQRDACVVVKAAVCVDTQVLQLDESPSHYRPQPTVWYMADALSFSKGSLAHKRKQELTGPQTQARTPKAWMDDSHKGQAEPSNNGIKPCSAKQVTQEVGSE